MSEALFKIQWHESFESCRWWGNCYKFFLLPRLTLRLLRGMPLLLLPRRRGNRSGVGMPRASSISGQRHSQGDFRLGADARVVSLSRGDCTVFRIREILRRILGSVHWITDSALFRQLFPIPLCKQNKFFSTFFLLITFCT